MNNKIKICHIITKLELGGAQQNTLYTVGHLNTADFETVLISGTGGILDDETKALNNTKVYFLKSLVREISLINDLLAFINITFILIKEKPEIVHTHSSKAGIIGRFAAFLARVPVIIHTFHGFGFNDFQSWPVKKIYILVEIAAAWVSDKLVAVSQQNIQKGLASNIGVKEKYVLIRSGIDTKFYKNIVVDKGKKKKELGVKENETIITTIGPFKPQKNLMDLLRTANLVTIKKDNCIFLIIGDGEERGELERYILNHNLSDRIKLLGWRRDVAELLHITDIFVMTSLWEGLPRSCLEAMCCGLPIVANSIDGVKEVVVNDVNGYLVEPYNTDKMASCILKILEDKALAQKMGKSSLKLIDEQYDINFMVKQQEELYLSLTNIQN
jgi:glycosyltransferase involved in cell wall biosynthesis